MKAVRARSWATQGKCPANVGPGSDLQRQTLLNHKWRGEIFSPSREHSARHTPLRWVCFCPAACGSSSPPLRSQEQLTGDLLTPPTQPSKGRNVLFIFWTWQQRSSQGHLKLTKDWLSSDSLGETLTNGEGVMRRCRAGNAGGEGQVGGEGWAEPTAILAGAHGSRNCWKEIEADDLELGLTAWLL